MQFSEEQIKEFKKQLSKALKSGSDNFNLKELGLDEELLKALELLMKELLTELKRESFRFVEEEKRIIDSRNKTIQSIGDLLIKNITSIRGFLLTLATVSLAVIGAVIPNLKLFNLPLVDLGLLSLAICVFVSIIYLTLIHVRENDELTNYLNFQKKALQELHASLLKCYQENKTFDAYLKEKGVLFDKNRKIEEEFNKKSEELSKKKDYIPYIISGSFLLGILLIVVSFFLNGK